MKTDESIKEKLKERFEKDDIMCPICENYTFEYFGDICPICGWEHDLVQSFDFDVAGFANQLSANEYKHIFIERRKINPNYIWKNDSTKHP